MMRIHPPSAWEELESWEAAERDRHRRLAQRLTAAGVDPELARVQAFLLLAMEDAGD